jgi:hypothetical protein
MTATLYIHPPHINSILTTMNLIVGATKCIAIIIIIININITVYYHEKIIMHKLKKKVAQIKCWIAHLKLPNSLKCAFICKKRVTKIYTHVP